VRDAGDAPCRQVAQLAREKVSQLDLQIAQLTQLRDSLTITLREWHRRLDKGHPNDRVHLLESLSRKQQQHTINSAGEENEDIRARRVNGSSGISLRSKRHVLPYARTAPAGI